jgi:large subunit ribosomal protein L13
MSSTLTARPLAVSLRRLPAACVANTRLSTPLLDTGDYIVVINAEKIRVSGRKATDKMYYHHTGFPGGIKEISFDKLIDKAPERVIQTAVKGMLPKNPLGRAMFRKLKVYAGPEHNHAAQQPKPLDI